MGSRLGPGTFIAVVGPSGSGKDTLLRGAKERFAAHDAVVFPRRIITRPPGDDNEDHIAVSQAQFVADEAAGDFTLSWAAHGLYYGLARAVEDDVRAGKIVIVNLSRGILPVLRQRYARRLVVSVQVDPANLRQRLIGRGRENQAEIATRLACMGEYRVNGDDVVVIDNSGPPEEAINRLCALILPLATTGALA